MSILPPGVWPDHVAWADGPGIALAFLVVALAGVTWGMITERPRE